MDKMKLISKSINAQKFSYSPYSKFKVGAALLTKNGTVYTACNVESASFGASICAERAALCKAISQGECDFAAIAVTSSGGEHTIPCGICRQMLAELAPGIIIITSGPGGLREYTIEKLLPEAFEL